MARKRTAQTRRQKQNHQLESVVSSGGVLRLGSAFFAALKPKKVSVNNVIIIMALASVLLLAAFVLVLAIRGEK